MLNATRIVSLLFALIALGTGGKAIASGLSPADVAPFVDNGHRFFAAIWFSVGLGLTYCVATIRESTALFRFLMLAIFVGGLARAIGLLDYAPERRLLVAIAIEMLLPPLLVWMQSKIRAR